MTVIVECEHVVKRYGDVIAVNDVSLSIEEGEVFGLVGPNGAGKTTLIEMIESLRIPDNGSIGVLGLNPVKEADELREKIGVQLQTTSIQPNIKVKEGIKLFAGLYRQPLANPEELLKTLSLEDKADSRFRKLSGGQKQRVAIALALVNDPAVLFFDELTTGLDPRARKNTWELVKDIKRQGKTIFLTTHYMEEAEELCDRVAVIDFGKIIALDTPENLIRDLGAESKVLFRVEGGDEAAAEFEGLAAVSRVEKIQDEVILYTTDGSATLQELVRFADKQGLRLGDIRTEFPDLDDVFLTLTGRELRE
ncbi:MAG: ABC transporter ATP-binding protein [Fidelibacterota bacterium]|nr:MAG: ABC transporter ATP-binding protein [Candidatus Neomarinimicrobiota bacterium]